MFIFFLFSSGSPAPSLPQERSGGKHKKIKWKKQLKSSSHAVLQSICSLYCACLHFVVDQCSEPKPLKRSGCVRPSNRGPIYRGPIYIGHVWEGQRGWAGWRVFGILMNLSPPGHVNFVLIKLPPWKSSRGEWF